MSTIDSINNGVLGTIRSQTVQSRQDPAEKFKELDSDNSGGLDKTELSVLAQELTKMIGKTLDIASSITSYDTNEDGELSEEEMNSMMRDTLGPPPEMGQQAASLSFTSEEDENLQTLLSLLEEMNQKFSGLQGSPPPGPPPDTGEKFAELDTDDNGTLNQAELDAMAEKINTTTGQSVDMAEAISNYDTDGDGELNQDEMGSLMQAQDDAPLSADNSVRMRLAANTYQATSNMDRIDELRQLMEQVLAGSTTNSNSDTSSS